MPETAVTLATNDALFATVYARLKALASRQIQRNGATTLDTTALVHELYLRIGTDSDLKVAGRTSAFYFKGKNEDVREIGKKLNERKVTTP